MADSPPREVTQLLIDWSSGDQAAFDKLVSPGLWGTAPLGPSLHESGTRRSHAANYGPCQRGLFPTSRSEKECAGRTVRTSSPSPHR